VLEVPAAEPVVARWRRALDPAAADGMPAHVTLVFPFLPEPQLDAGVNDDLRRICASFPPLAVSFTGFGEFPGVLYLEPRPAAPIVALVEELVRRWPQAPPYAGVHDSIVPHLTLALGADEHALRELRAALSPSLPLRDEIDAVSLYVRVAGSWARRRRFPLGRAADA